MDYQNHILRDFLNKYGASQMTQVVKNPPASAGDEIDTGSIPESGRFPGGENGNPLQYSCLGNPMDREACWTTVHGVSRESDMTEHLSAAAA